MGGGEPYFRVHILSSFGHACSQPQRLAWPVTVSVAGGAGNGLFGAYLYCCLWRDCRVLQISVLCTKGNMHVCFVYFIISHITLVGVLSHAFFQQHKCFTRVDVMSCIDNDKYGERALLETKEERDMNLRLKAIEEQLAYFHHPEQCEVHNII